MRLTRPVVLAAAAIALVTIIVYGRSVSGEFVSDDVQNVRDNELLRSLDWDHLRGIVTSFDDANYIPVKVLSLAVDTRLWGPAPAGFHVTNVILHVLCALLVYSILLRLDLPSLPAGLAALAWAVHPLQVESVAWISERKNVLSGLFFFAAFRFYLSYSESGRARTYAALLALFVLAVLSKMNTLVLPAVCLAYEAAFRFRVRRRDWLSSLPLFGIGFVVAWFNLSGNPIHGSTYHGGSALVTWLSSAVVVFRYLGNVLLPARLCVFYDVPLRDSLLSPPVLVSVAGLLLVAGLAVGFRRSRRRAGFWILWFVITLAPMLNLIPFRSLMNDRYMYLALLGPIAFVAFLASDGSPSPAVSRTLAVAAAAAIAACAALGFIRVGVFASELTLWEDWTPRLAYVAADVPYVQPDFEAKVAFLRGALSGGRGSAAIENNLGALYFEADRTDEAIPLLEAAAARLPGSAPVLVNLGRALTRSGDLVRARRTLMDAVAAAPYDFLSHLSLARVDLRLKDAAGARRELEACGRIRPNPADAAYWAGERDDLRRLEESGR